MIWLARLLIREKRRKILAQYGWTGCAGFALMLLLLAPAAGAAFSRLLEDIPLAQVPLLLNRVWLGWIAAGVLIGKDLTWRIHLERLNLFPAQGFVRLYLVGFVLSFASFPLLLILAVVGLAGTMRAGFSLSGLAATLAACGLLAASVRLVVSCARCGIGRSWALSKLSKVILSIVMLVFVGWNLSPAVNPGLETLLPGYQFGLVLAGTGGLRAIALLAGFIVLLSIVDFVLQRDMTFAGMGGAPAPRSRMMSRGGLLLVHPSWPATLWRVSLLGWVRNRNALLLVMWGILYGFFFMYFSGLEKAGDFMLFSWMVLIFHSYLRGNLLGVDHKGVWLYYMLPSPVRMSLRSKNRTLSLLQGCMVAAVLLPGLIRPSHAMDLAAWSGVVSYALSSILLGEISGSFFSLRYPEPIERSDHFSGGTTPGALVIPFLQIALLGVFLFLIGPGRQVLPLALFWLGVAAIPALLWFVRSTPLSIWVEKTMTDERRTIMSRLTVFTS